MTDFELEQIADLGRLIRRPLPRRSRRRARVGEGEGGRDRGPIP